ncbi:TOBE domain-containing protein [Streptomyces sp. NPDC046931]|uniref:TOBE domain-containing protein n=1 Tax=Streptomyces sp. NPDC046931 TaxID=3154806 RepID=UPI0033CEC71B
MGVRPECVEVVTDPGPNTFTGRLRSVTDHGAQRVLEVEMAGQLVRTKTLREEGVPAGEEVLVHLPRAKVLPYADGKLILPVFVIRRARPRHLPATPWRTADRAARHGALGDGAGPEALRRVRTRGSASRRPQAEVVRSCSDEPPAEMRGKPRSPADRLVTLTVAYTTHVE